MNNILAFKVNLKWIPVIDKHRYPLKGVYHVFIQNIFELLFLVGFVWYFKWPPLFVLCCCMVEACALCFFSTLKIKSSTGLFYKIKDKLGWISGITCVALCIGQALVFFSINPQENIVRVVELFWNDNEFLFCVVAVAIQPYLEYVKYKKTVQLFPSDIECICKSCIEATCTANCFASAFAVIDGLFWSFIISARPSIVFSLDNSKNATWANSSSVYSCC